MELQDLKNLKPKVRGLLVWGVKNGDLKLHVNQDELGFH